MQWPLYDIFHWMVICFCMRLEQENLLGPVKEIKNKQTW